MTSKPLHLLRYITHLALLACALGSASYGQSGNGVVTTSLKVGLQGSFFFNNGDQSEWIDVSGDIHLVVQAIPGNPVIPGNPIRVHTNMAGITGIGRTSGTQYVINGSENFELSSALPASLQFQGLYRLIPGNPIIPGNPVSPNPILPVFFALSVDETGTGSSALAVINANN